MTTRADLLRTIEKIEIDIAETSRRPTIIQRLKFFLSQKTVASWITELGNIKQHVKQRSNSYVLGKTI
jgi:hypothetical protein